MTGRTEGTRRESADSEILSPRRRTQAPPSGVLGLQRMAGNAATASLIQRETKGKKGKKGKEPDKPKRKYHTISGNALDWDVPKLNGWAVDRRNEGDLLQAAAYWQYAYEKGANKVRQYAWNTYLMFRELGWEEDKKYWLDVSNGDKKHPLLPEFQHA